jgi:F-type H+-transporting ATPase subunit gamma
LPSTSDLYRRIRSVKGTQQITKAMKMVAAAKLRRAQQRIVEARPYADVLTGVLGSLAARCEHSHPLLEVRDGGRAWVVVVSSDKGLCGSFNANLFREVERKLKADEWAEPELVTIGRKASEHYSRRRWKVVHEERKTMANATADDGARLGDMFVQAFLSGQVDSVWLCYNRFLSLMRHEHSFERLLPLEPPQADEEQNEARVDYLYEPDPTSLLEALLPLSVEVKVQTAIYDSVAAEHAARMTAMDAATKNADDMIESLTLLYNRTRQAAITKELLEIVSGAEALEK